MAGHEDARRPRVRLMESLSDATRALLLEGSRRREFRPGDIVFHDGDPARELHVVTNGHFSLHVILATGEEVMLRVLGVGEPFGEMALFGDDGTRAATVRAMDQATTTTIDRRKLQAVMRDDAAVAGVLLELLAEKVRAGDARLLEALFVPAEIRVLRRLVEVADLYAAANAAVVEVPLRQEDLAALAGASRGTVNRILRAEEARGSLELARSRTRILDRAALRAAARSGF